MHILVLGSAAGGGFPQWNCNCELCCGVRHRTLQTKARMQSSIAVSFDRTRWILINASPDILHQVAKFPELRKEDQLRDTAIQAVVLTDSQIDHTTGLLFLREGKPLHIYATDVVKRDLTGNFPIFTMLQKYCGVEHHTISEKSFTIPGMEELIFTPIALEGHAPPYSSYPPTAGDNIALRIQEKGGKSVVYAPCLGHVTPTLQGYLDEADCVLVDGTFWQNEEMQKRSVGAKTARDMGHIPQSGAGGMVELLKELPSSRKVLIHINNTNPILDEGSKERALLKSAKIEVAEDGMEICI